MTQPQPPLLVKGRTAAQMLSISPRTLWALTQAGEIPVVRIGKHSVRYSPAALGKWIAERQEGATPLIPDSQLEGDVRRLIVLAELAVAAFSPSGHEDERLLAGLQLAARNVRERLHRTTEAPAA